MNPKFECENNLKNFNNWAIPFSSLGSRQKPVSTRSDIIVFHQHSRQNAGSLSAGRVMGLS